MQSGRLRERNSGDSIVGNSVSLEHQAGKNSGTPSATKEE